MTIFPEHVAELSEKQCAAFDAIDYDILRVPLDPNPEADPVFDSFFGRKPKHSLFPRSRK